MSTLDSLDDELADLDLSQLAADEPPLTAADSGSETSQPTNSMQFFKHIPVEITVEIAQKKLLLSELMDIKTDSVVMLDKEEGEPVDIKVNGKLFGQGEIIEQDHRYGVKIIHVIDSFEEK